MRVDSPSPSTSMRRWHTRWVDALDRCLALSADPDAVEARAAGVSAWSVGQQLEHVMLADTRVLDSIERLSQAEADGLEVTAGSPSLVGRIVLATGFIPRGRATAPEATLPGGMDAEALARRLGEVRDRVSSLEESLGALESVRGTSRHPILGRFTPRRWVQFSGVHHAHHWRIVQDILKAAGVRSDG